jgi:D-arabinose 1-dehydrogenase-like Zn-dependent alcohol dehydrogenase
MKTKMKAAQISKAGGDFELVERDIPEPGPGQVRLKVEACGICHSDVLVKEGLWPGLQYPRVTKVLGAPSFKSSAKRTS